MSLKKEFPIWGMDAFFYPFLKENFSIPYSGRWISFIYLYQIMIYSSDRCQGSIIYPKFIEDMDDVAFYSMVADPKLPGYLHVCRPMGYHAQHFKFSIGQGSWQ
jgi:hypothetical protein